VKAASLSFSDFSFRILETISSGPTPRYASKARNPNPPIKAADVLHFLLNWENRADEKASTSIIST
jgi:hypothetical protein